MKKLAIVLWGLMLFAVQPVAGQFTPQLLPDAPSDPTTVWFGGTVANYTETIGTTRVYVGPYWAHVGGTPASVYCVDFAHEVSAGNTWTAYATPLNGSGDLSHTLQNNYQVYQQTAFLASLFSELPMSDANWSALHGAIWAITNPSFLTDAQRTAFNLNTIFQTGALSAYSQYHNAWMAYDPSQWYVLTDVRASEVGATGIKQEFLVQSTVPEPETYVLLLSGLVMIFFVARRRMKENGYI